MIMNIENKLHYIVYSIVQDSSWRSVHNLAYSSMLLSVTFSVWFPVRTLLFNSINRDRIPIKQGLEEYEY